MSEMLDLGLRIANTVAIIITWLFLLITQVRKKIKQAQGKNTEKVMNINKEKQKEKEKELEPMAVFLCDKCGAQVKVSDAKQYENFDVCAACYDKLNRKDGELKQLDAQIAEYERVLAELKQRKDQVEHE